LATPVEQNRAMLLSMELQEVVSELHDLRARERDALLRRDALLGQLSEHGVSHRALAVLADLARPRVSGIISHPPTYERKAPKTRRRDEIDISTVNAEFPCCGHAARFTANEHELIHVRKRCHHCQRRYELTRAKGPIREDGRRVDFITWRLLSEE
jgi:hypothetical protein